MTQKLTFRKMTVLNTSCLRLKRSENNLMNIVYKHNLTLCLICDKLILLPLQRNRVLARQEITLPLAIQRGIYVMFESNGTALLR